MAEFFTWPRVAALVVATALLAGGVGYRLGEPGNPDLNDVDIGFLADMSAHHQGAVSLSFTYLPNQNDKTVTLIAQGIVRSQVVEISLMTSRLSNANDDRVDAVVNDDVAMEWMGDPVEPAEMPGLASTAEFEELESSSGVDADDLFTRLMIDHHAAGVEMAEYVIEHGHDDVTRRLARAMAEVQRTEIGELNNRRAALGLDRVEISDDQNGDGHSH